ncbi:hypothetical protein [Mycolicibacterium sp. CR10]|uniref:hypothetical protein n=1 Tax=Mycolicibacterium sp. CR10 TaxID=2562314 RepID=UPI0010C120F2|nr:hypothetical protein [Mycolicibacterium sp. CR10]
MTISDIETAGRLRNQIRALAVETDALNPEAPLGRTLQQLQERRGKLLHEATIAELRDWHAELEKLYAFSRAPFNGL